MTKPLNDDDRNVRFTRTIAERLAERLVRMPNGCLEWTGSLSTTGYGHIKVTGKPTKTHRIAWELTNGPIPDGMFVCHHCDNPPCCDVTHLFLGTNADNLADMSAKGRHHSQVITHCPSGHEYDEANTKFYGGRRYCRACHKSGRAANG